MIGIFSAGIQRIPHLEAFLGEPCRKLSLLRPVPDGITRIAVWGYRPTGGKAVARAEQSGLPVLRLEDGFIRSLGLGVSGCPPLSMVLETQGMYYDASKPSTLEMLIRQREENQPLQDTARQAMQIIVEGDLSKYNQAPACTKAKPECGAVLVVDQTFGDMAVVYGNAGAEQFEQMLQAAMAENPTSEIWVKIHPDVLLGKKAGYFTQITQLAQQDPRIKLLAENVSPQSLLRVVSRVYVVTSNYGFEALIAGKPVSVFGQPWYAGWGLTDDRHPQSASLRARRGTASLEELFSAACLRYSRYINPANGKSGTLFDVLSWLLMQRKHQQQRAGRLWSPGLTLWKRSILGPFLRTKSNKVNFSKRYAGEVACVVWGIKGEARWGAQAQQRQIPQWRMEDGFLRSAGLGSDLHPPLSLVLDKTGIYYDATRPSDLELLLSHSNLAPCQQQRAATLRQRLVASKVSKYNLGAAFTLPAEATNKTVILVPGQVEDDASILTGTISLRTNSALLRTVRERNPGAYIIYKPHPDVLVGNRQGHIPAEDVSRWADSQALDADIIQCIQAADELHTLTSLSGFEALLHGKKVVCYGMPFYAGWGLTQDEHACSRRLRSLTLDDVVYQALIAYPSYIDPQSREPILAEQAVELLAATPRAQMQFTRVKAGRIVRYYRKLLMLVRVTLTT
ncbi:capsular polysaccharide biosynthesis protein [Rahnella aceris]|uniref:capsular polysaccharide biosynthesis protein n=1 Tax=Rahnella sp. (strain Y9602) TaxID=2703885 RepID=UPI00141F42A2|nr:capsular polysaccharide biosynthesis protein [Rahnella aceris]NIA87084.1 capsular polysaccharide biosynthesis protein [Rahnella aceris]UNK55111.1 capsular polysaccharide biosynthesis protein [Rahnella aceris]